jgi:hypothetical protein
MSGDDLPEENRGATKSPVATTTGEIGAEYPRRTASASTANVEPNQKAPAKALCVFRIMRSSCPSFDAERRDRSPILKPTILYGDI